MTRVLAGGLALILFIVPSTMLRADDTARATHRLSAAEIANRNVAARGGLEAWRAVQSISFTGKMEAGGKANTELPFVLQMKRGRKSRLELQFRGQTAVQVYDGSNGWKLRPFLNRHEVETFTNDEMQKASAQSELDGPLVDYIAKGNKIELLGVEKVRDADAYKLKLTTKDGQVRDIWIDQTSFLEVKVEDSPRRMDGRMHPVATYYEEYRPINGGLVFPYRFETAVDGVKQTESMRIESVVVNPKLDDSLFSKPR